MRVYYDRNGKGLLEVKSHGPVAIVLDFENPFGATIHTPTVSAISARRAEGRTSSCQTRWRRVMATAGTSCAMGSLA